MPTLHYHPSNASFAPHVLLREIGAPFELALVDRAHGAHKSAAYLKLNPNGLIPVWVDGDLVLYETAAICLHLCDRHAAAGLAPPAGSDERAHFYKWLSWLSTTLQPALIVYFYPDRLIDEGDPAPVKRRAEARVVELLAQVDDQLSKGPWMLGERYGALDPYAFMLCRWTRGFALRKAREFPHIGPWMQRVIERPAVQEAYRVEQLVEPWY